MYRNRNSSKKYLDRKNKDKCALCILDDFSVLEETEHTAVVKNNYPYDIWEGTSVKEHLMIVPKSHVAALSEINQGVLREIITLAAKYEGWGYNVYTRSLGSPLRSIRHHQHTHLIKLDGQPAKAIIYVNKPYVLIKI